MQIPSAKKLLWIGLFLSFAAAAMAALNPTGRYNSRAWHREDGLPDERVSSVAQTTDGYVWVATARGLVRFDGTHFWPAPLPVTLPGDTARNLWAGPDNTLWIGSARGEIFLWRANAFRNLGSVRRGEENGIITLRQSRAGTLWIGTRFGLYAYDGKRLEHIEHAGLRRDTIRSIAEADDGTMWFGGSYGVFSGRDGKFTALEMEPGTKSGVKTILPSGHETLWVAALGKLLHYEKGKLKTVLRTGGLVEPTVTALHQDRRDGLWLGTSSGLQRLDGGKFLTEITDEGDFYDAVSCILEDRERNLWIGTQDGLYQLAPKLFTTFTTRDGLAHNNVTSVLEDSAGALWIGLWGGGLQRNEGGAFTTYTKAKGQSDAMLHSELVLALCQARDGALWLGYDFSSGIERLQDGKLQTFSKTSGISPNAARVILQDARNRLWIGMNGALDRFENETFTHFTSRDGLAGDNVADLAEDSSGNLWIATDRGLSVRQNEKFTPVKLGPNGKPVDVGGLHLDTNAVLWVASIGSGLWRADLGTNADFSALRFKNYNRSHGLVSDAIFGLLEDDSGDLWMTSGEGISRAKKADFDRLDRGEIKTLNCVAYDRSDGLNSLVCTRVAKPAAWKGKDGRLWFATAKGLATIDSRQPMDKNELAPAILISHVIANGERHLVTDGTEEIKLKPGEAEMEFYFSALSFTAPEKNRFKYKLEGVDKDWVDAGNQRFARYHRITPGSYRFRVVGCNNAGVWNLSSTGVQLTLPPFFWQQWWFKAALGTGLLAALWIAYRVRIARLRAVENLRMKIASDLHDDVGASLTKVSVLVGRIEKGIDDPPKTKPLVQKVSVATREIIRAMDEIVWTINPRNDTAEDFAGYVCHYAHEFFQGTGIRCRFDVPPDLPRFQMPAEMRHNLFLACKEVLNNIVKHSGAGEVFIQLLVRNRKLSIEIVDNGCGFDPANHSGNGLENLRRRLRDMGGDCVFETKPGAGTKINMEIPVG